MRIDNNEEVMDSLKENMTLVQKTVFDEILNRVSELHLTGSHLYDTVHSRSDFDFYVSQSSVAPIADFEQFLGNLCSFKKEEASKYNDNNQTGDYFGNVVYRLDIGIDIQVVYEHRMEEKRVVDNAIKDLCNVFDIDKNIRAYIMELAIDKNRTAEKKAEREILGEDVHTDKESEKLQTFVEQAIKRLNHKASYNNNPFW